MARDERSGSSARRYHWKERRATERPQALGLAGAEEGGPEAEGVGAGVAAEGRAAEVGAIHLTEDIYRLSNSMVAGCNRRRRQRGRPRL